MHWAARRGEDTASLFSSAAPVARDMINVSVIRTLHTARRSLIDNAIAESFRTLYEDHGVAGDSGQVAIFDLRIRADHAVALRAPASSLSPDSNAR